MNILHYFHFLEPLQDHVTKVYSTTSEIIVIFLVFWTLNFIAGLIQRTYATGLAFGGFYRKYLHKYFKGGFNKLTSILNRGKAEALKTSEGSCSVRSAT